MKGWIADIFRTVWALFYLNARKTFYVLRKRQSQSPCQNPSDSGLAMETGCDVITQCARPDRLRRACPLLARNDQGTWVCSVAAAEVRPFWGRTFAYVGSFVVLTIALATGLAYGGMRAIGYEVSLRQVIWPPAWDELREVQAEFFIAQARQHYTDGEVREQPDRRSETTRVWFQSLLSRGRMDEIAQLAQRQLSVEPEQSSA